MSTTNYGSYGRVPASVSDPDLRRYLTTLESKVQQLSETISAQANQIEELKDKLNEGTSNF